MPELSGGWVPNGLCSLFVCDIAAFGHPARNDLDRAAVRTALYEGLRKSFDAVEVPFRICYVEDRGDGALMAIPPRADTSVLVTTLIDRLRAEVRRHNHVSVPTAQLRLRVAVHTGVVHFDGNGLVGTAVNLAFRLLEAEQLKLTLSETGADLALIVSIRVYDDVIRHGLGLVDPSEYQRVVIDVKETVMPAWIMVPGIGKPRSAIFPTPVTVIDTRTAAPTAPTPPAAPAATSLDPPALPAADLPPALPAVGPPTLPAPVAIVHPAPDLDTLVDLALDIRQLRVRQLREQIVAELPLALTQAITKRRAKGDRAELIAIIRTCSAHPHGLRDLLHVVRQFAGNSAQVTELGRSIDAMERA
jgi:hypothetical protein